MRAHDTHEDAYRLQLSLYRAMTPERKGEIAAQMSVEVRRIARDGIRHRHPEYSDTEASRALIAALFGHDIPGPSWPHWETCPVNTDVAPFLSRLVAALEQAGVSHMLAGSFASSVHGAPRATRDIDIVIDPTIESLDRLLALLTDADLYVDPSVARDELRRRGQFNAIDRSTAWKADLIYRKARPFSRAEFERRTPLTLLGVRVFVATAEDTILAKLEWAKLGQSEQQLRDVGDIIEAQADALDRAYIESWLDNLGVRELWERPSVV